MKLVCVGFNWKTPVHIRERLAFDAAKLAKGLDQLHERYPQGEFAILSTCNRTEIYGAGETSHEAGGESISQFLASFHALPLPDFAPFLYQHEGATAARHLFEVACGLDSLVLGEAQIVGQVRHAYQTAVEHATAGTLLHSLFQRALAASKRVQTETELSRGRLSIASVAVDFVRDIFESFNDKTVLVIGAGKMAELTLTHLTELRPGKLLVCNRSPEPAKALAERFGGTVAPFDRLLDQLALADIVVSSTGAEHAIVSCADFEKVMAARKQNLTAVVDIAVPRDFDPEIGSLENVLLWNIDDFEKVRLQTLKSRAAELEDANLILDEETLTFQAAVALQQSGPVIGRIEEDLQRVVEQELAWLMPQLNGITADQQEKIRHFAHRLKNKFLHPAKSALRQKAKQGEHHGLIDAMKHLFGLDRE